MKSGNDVLGGPASGSGRRSTRPGPHEQPDQLDGSVPRGPLVVTSHIRSHVEFCFAASPVQPARAIWTGPSSKFDRYRRGLTRAVVLPRCRKTVTRKNGVDHFRRDNWTQTASRTMCSVASTSQSTAQRPANAMCAGVITPALLHSALRERGRRG